MIKAGYLKTFRSIPPCFIGANANANGKNIDLLENLFGPEVTSVMHPIKGLRLKKTYFCRRSSPGENVFYCPICYENIKNIGGRTVVLPCGHVFCRGCLFACFQTKKICPLCQVAFNDPPNIMEIFL